MHGSRCPEILTNILQDPSLEECLSDYRRARRMPDRRLTTTSRLHCSEVICISHVKWIISSRNWRNIEERLEIAEQKVRLSLELNAESISTAVSTYIRHKVLWLAQAERITMTKHEMLYKTICPLMRMTRSSGWLWSVKTLGKSHA